MPSAPSDNPFLGSDSSVRSLNRARIVALAGVPAADALGKSGYDLLSAASLDQQIAAAAAELRIDLALPDRIRQLDGCFDRPDTRPLAQLIAREYGRRLGCLLLMLVRGEPANRAARPDWSGAHWAFWQAQRRVALGGGLLAGQLGAQALAAAQALLAGAGAADLVLERAPFGAHLPLVGLARAAPPGVSRSLLFDFGQTSVKRGWASYEAGRLARVELWPDTPSVCDELFAGEESDSAVERRWERMAELIAEGWAALRPGERQRTAVCIALACYLFGGHPSPHDRGCYGVLQRLGRNLAAFMAESLARRLGQAVPLALLHDGAAAAAVYAGAARTVVITLGTAIGNGFPPDAGAVWPFAPGFRLLAPRPTASL